MFEFSLYALILLLMALGFIIVPLMLAKPVVRESDDATNIELAKFKLRELRAELGVGNLSQAEFAAAKRELEVGLYHDLKDGDQPSAGAGNGRWLVFPLAFIVPVMALLLYAQLGDFRAFEPSMAQASQRPTEDQINAMVEGLAKRLQQKPDDLQGWLMLGRSYKAMKRYPDAAQALKRALSLQPDNADLMLQLADTLAMINGGSLQGEPTTYIEQAVALKPDSEMGMWLSGLSKAEQGQLGEAIATWRKLQQHYQPGSDDYQEVQELIDTALARSGQTVDAPQAKATTSTAAVAEALSLRVEIADSLKANVTPEDSVMIYAQAANGPKMPLAVVKRQVKELPLQITLDDSLAMMPSMKLSSVDDIVVTARVSRSGGATPQSGEPVGKVNVDKQRQPVTVVIDGQVP